VNPTGWRTDYLPLEQSLTAFVYMLRCADGSYYVGSARGESLDGRLAEHQAGARIGSTYHRRPVTLIYAEWFDRIVDAVAAERRIKGWGRAKKEALIAEDWDRVQFLAKRPSARARSSNPTTSS
jgi:putative endonuclease